MTPLSSPPRHRTSSLTLLPHGRMPHRRLALVFIFIFLFMTLAATHSDLDIGDTFQDPKGAIATAQAKVASSFIALRHGMKGLKEMEWDEWKWSDDGDVENRECGEWGPGWEEWRDPGTGCLRARQYRQTMRALSWAEERNYGWYFTHDHNIAVLRNVSRCFLPPSDPEHRECPRKPLMIGGWWYTALVTNGGRSGETIWQENLMKQFEELGLHWIAVGGYEDWVTAAEMMPDVYRFISTVAAEAVQCITDPRCIAKDHYVPPDGAQDLSDGVPDEERGVIPIWALQVFSYWGSAPKEASNNDYWWGLTEDGPFSFHPLGSEFISTPFPCPNHTHLPYSIEEHCLALPDKVHEDRTQTALILAKRTAYFHYHYVSPPDFWTRLAGDPTVELMTTADVEEGHNLPDGLTSLGMQTREGYEELVASTRALLGIGAPPISPSVYTALCQGTPVVVPYFFPPDKMRWDGWYRYMGAWAQHGPASMIGEPYVYSYYAQNYTDLEDKVHRAMATPIERYVPEDMRHSYCLERARDFAGWDREARFRQIVGENGGKIPALRKGAREACFATGQCKAVFEPGRRPRVPPTKGQLLVVKELIKVNEAGLD